MMCLMFVVAQRNLYRNAQFYTDGIGNCINEIHEQLVVKLGIPFYSFLGSLPGYPKVSPHYWVVPLFSYLSL